MALAEITRDMMSAIKEVSKVLAVRGAGSSIYSEGSRAGGGDAKWSFVTGETAIRNCQEAIKQICSPSECKPLRL